MVQHELLRAAAAVHVRQCAAQLGAVAGYANVDAAVQKDVALGRGTRLQLRWEIFNLLNRTNFDVPNRVAFTPNFGRIFSAKPPRQMQFGVKLLF